MPRQTLERFGALIHHIYDAGLNPALWPEVIDHVRTAVNGSGALLMTPLHPIDAGGLAITANLEPTFLQEYASRYQGEDLWIKTFAEKDLLVSGNVMTGEEVIPRKELLATQFYHQIQKPLDIGRLMVSIIFGRDAEHVQTTSLSVFRKVGASAFRENAKDTMRLLVPHLSRALGIMYRLRDAEFRVATSIAALDRLAAGIVLLDANGGVLFANSAALEVLQGGDGISLHRAPGALPRIRGTTAAQQQAIEKTIMSALKISQLDVSHFSKSVRIARPSGASPVVINVSALPLSNEFDTGPSRPRAIAFVTDTARSISIDATLLCELYEVTETEALIVARICAGQTPSQIADARGVSEETVKTQLKSVFRKTGTSRQADLVKLTLSLSSGIV